MLFLVSMMSTHAEDWKVKERDPLDKCNQWSKEGWEKGTCCCGRITEGGTSGGGGFLWAIKQVTQRTNGALVVPRALLGRQSTRLPHKLMEMFLQKERKKQPKKSHSIFNCMGEAVNSLEDRIIVQDDLWQTGEMRWESKIGSWPIRTNAKF